MDPTTGPINDMFDFDAYDDDAHDVRLIADQHLFSNGPDLFGLNPVDVAGETMISQHSGPAVVPIAYPAPEQNVNFPIPAQGFFDNNLNFTNENFALLQQPASQFIARQSHGREGLPFDRNLPTVPDLTQSSPQFMLTTLEEQRQWQAFKHQQKQFSQPQTQFFQPQPQFFQPQPQFLQPQAQYFHPQPQAPPHQSVQLGENIENASNLDLLPPLETTADSAPSEIEQVSKLEVPHDSQQVSDPSEQTILSYEQINLLQNAEATESAEPSLEPSPATATVLRDEAIPVLPPRSRSTLLARPSPSSRTETSEESEVLDSLHGAPLEGLSFVSLDDAEEAMASRYIENTWKAPSPDQTVPKTQKKRAKYVLAMFQSFQDTSRCKDNKNGHSYLKRWYRGPGSYYSLQAMEKVCWHMLDIAERMHAQGPQSTGMYCEEALKKVKASRNLTFEQRIHHICAMLEYSKYACDRLMKGEELEAMVGAPEIKMAGALTMQVQNQKRQKWIVHGRTEDPLHANTASNEGDFQNDDEDAPRSQRKTKPNDKRTTPAEPRAKPKARSSEVLHAESDDDEEESVNRRQSGASIAQFGHGPDTEMVDEPQQLVVSEPSPSPIRQTGPQAVAYPSQARGDFQGHRVPVLTSTPPPVASPAAPLVSPTWSTSSSVLSSPPASALATSPILSPSPMRLSDLALSDSEIVTAPQAKRQRTYKDLFAEWMIRNDGSNDDDLREAGYATESGRLSNKSDTKGNDQTPGEDGENITDEGNDDVTPAPSPARKRKIEKATVKGGEIGMTPPLVQGAGRTIRPAPKSNKRKSMEGPESPGSEHEPTPPAKRTKRKNGSPRKSATPVPTKTASNPALPSQGGKSGLARGTKANSARRN